MEQKFWHKSYAEGVNPDPDFEKTTISEALTRTAGRFPENCALNYMGFRISYSALNRYVNQSCRALEAKGIRPGDKVAVCLPNIPQAAIANYAILRAGAVAVQLNPLYTEREMIYQLDDSDSRGIITLSLLVPRMEKISVGVGVGEAIANKKLLDSAVKEIELITGQHAVKTKARKSIANFKLRQGMEIGAKVTLRGDRMWEFLDRLVNVALPRVKDFRGVSPNAFDGHGNYALGVTEQIIFPEIDYDKIERVSGLNIVIVTTADTDEEAFALLKKIGMPFSK